MNLVDLIIMVCALATPGACEEKHILFESGSTLTACMWQAQPFLAQWVGEHPNLRVASFRCAWPDSEGKSI